MKVDSTLTIFLIKLILGALLYQEISLTKFGLRQIPAAASKIDEYGQLRKSDETTSSSVYDNIPHKFVEAAFLIAFFMSS